METMEEILEELRSGEFAPLADRIEAAHKREQEDAIAATVVAAAKSASEVYEPHIKSEPVGNAAKMREALVKSRKAMDEMSKSIFQGWIEDSLVNVVGEAQRAISSALSEPPRNCDLYATESDALKAWDGRNEEGAGDWFAFTDWLFAEAKGEAE